MATNISSFVLLIFFLATGVQILIWAVLFFRFAMYKEPLLDKTSDAFEEKPVSVIICARNEAQNLVENIPLFLTQNYPKFEVIVVNDHSNDETFDILFEIQQKNAIFRIVSMNGVKKSPGKKTALTFGINSAVYNQVLLTDADCKPASPEWIRLMQSKLGETPTIVLGYSPYSYIPDFLNTFIRYEAVYTAMQYFSMALWKLPYMGVGRNLLYTRSLFFEGGQFSSHAHLASGDDDLFINQVATKNNTKVNLHPSTFTISIPKHTWRGYYHQKSRHLTTGIRYSLKHQLILGMISLSHFLHYFSAFLLLLITGYHEHIIFSYLVRIVVVWTVWIFVLQKLKDWRLVKWVPILDLLFIFYYMLFLPSLIGKNQKWK